MSACPSQVLKAFTFELNYALKTFISYGDSLEKVELKEFMKSLSNTSITWERFKKSISANVEEVVVQIKVCRSVIKEAKWLTDKFGDGKYTDVLGLCKIATIVEIEEKNWNLTPGAYVGVTPVIDDDVSFENRMSEIHKELIILQEEANRLMDIISVNFEGLGV